MGVDAVDEVLKAPDAYLSVVGLRLKAMGKLLEDAPPLGAEKRLGSMELMYHILSADEECMRMVLEGGDDDFLEKYGNRFEWVADEVGRKNGLAECAFPAIEYLLNE